MAKSIVKDTFKYPKRVGGPCVRQPAIGITEWRDKFLIVVSGTSKSNRPKITDIIGELPASALSKHGKLRRGRKMETNGKRKKVPEGMIRVEFLNGTYRLCAPIKKGVKKFLIAEMNFFKYPEGIPAFNYRILYPEKMEERDGLKKIELAALSMDEMDPLGGPGKSIRELLGKLKKAF